MAYFKEWHVYIIYIIRHFKTSIHIPLLHKYLAYIYHIEFIYLVFMLKPLIPILTFIFFLNCSNEPLLFSKSFFGLKTFITIKLVCNSSKKAEQLFSKIITKTDEIHKTFSAYDSSSEIFRINSSKNKDKLNISQQVYELIEDGINIGESTNGLFDISVAPVKWSWGFGGNLKNRIPDSTEMDSLLKLVDFKQISLNPNDSTLEIKNKNAKIDLGGISKGHALGIISNCIINEGVTSFLIEAGGDIFAQGNKPDGKPWIIGIRHPRSGKSLEILAKYKIDNDYNCCVTSGDYEQYFIKNGQRYHHIFNPKTGYPADSGCVSVSIFCNDPILADAMSTALFVLKPENALNYINRTPGLDGLVISGGNGSPLTCRLSKGLKDRIEIVR